MAPSLITGLPPHRLHWKRRDPAWARRTWPWSGAGESLSMICLSNWQQLQELW